MADLPISAAASPSVTIDPGWKPTACPPADDVWLYAGSSFNFKVLVQGGTQSTSACYPTSYTPSSAYLAETCPPGFASACQAEGTTICCPE
jgi:hypothetical protein